MILQLFDQDSSSLSSTPLPGPPLGRERVSLAILKLSMISSDILIVQSCSRCATEQRKGSPELEGGNADTAAYENRAGGSQKSCHKAVS